MTQTNHFLAKPSRYQSPQHVTLPCAEFQKRASEPNFVMDQSWTRTWKTLSQSMVMVATPHRLVGHYTPVTEGSSWRGLREGKARLGCQMQRYVVKELLLACSECSGDNCSSRPVSTPAGLGPTTLLDSVADPYVSEFLHYTCPFGPLVSRHQTCLVCFRC